VLVKSPVTTSSYSITTVVILEQFLSYNTEVVVLIVFFPFY